MLSLIHIYKKLVKVTATTRSNASKAVTVGIADESNVDAVSYKHLLAIEILEQVQHDSRIRVSNCNIIQFGRILQRNQVPSIHAKRCLLYTSVYPA